MGKSQPNLIPYEWVDQADHLGNKPTEPLEVWTVQLATGVGAALTVQFNRIPTERERRYFTDLVKGLDGELARCSEAP